MRATLSYFPTKKIWENNNMAVALQPLITVSTYAARRAQNIDGRRAQTMAEISAQRDIVSSVRQDIGQDFRINDSIKNTLYNFVVFVIGAEAVRSKLGLEQGLLGLMWSAVQYPFQRLLQDAPSLGEKTSAASTTSVVPLEQELDILTDLEPPMPASFDPTTLVGGPFWCTDLSLADPTGAMAYLTAAIIGLNVLLRPSRASAKSMREWLETLTFLEVIQLLFVPVFMIIGVRIPAGILLYTMWSVLSTKIMNVYFGIRNPRPRVIKPCTSFAPRINKKAT